VNYDDAVVAHWPTAEWTAVEADRVEAVEDAG
jgi:hypothetical protein